jgi:hypothetical protein
MLFIVNVVRSLLAGTCFYLAWKLLRDMPASRGWVRQENGTQIHADEPPPRPSPYEGEGDSW